LENSDEEDEDENIKIGLMEDAPKDINNL